MVSTVIGAVPAAIPEPFLRAQSVPGKFFLMFFAIFFFALVFGLVLFLASLFKGKNGERVQGALFVGPALVLLAVGLMYPAVLTIIQSIRGLGPGLRRPGELRGDTSPKLELFHVLRNTAVWVILAPIVATHRPRLRGARRPGPRREVRQGPDLPADGDLARRRGDHLEVRLRLPSHRGTQIGLLNAILKRRVDTHRFLLTEPWNTIFLIVDHDLDPGRVRDDHPLGRHQGDPRRDHRGRPARRRHRLQMFRYITVPSIRPSSSSC